jgi:hypothetical protein
MEEKFQHEKLDSVGVEKKPKLSKKFVSKLLLCLLVIILIAAAAGATYFWRDKVASDIETKQEANISSLEKTIVSLNKQLAVEKAKIASSSTTCSAVRPISSTVESIMDSISSGNTAALNGYMAPSVNVILAASEGMGAQTPSQAVSDITNFISDATSPWDFSLSASVLSSYSGGGYGKYFSTIAVVGKSANGKVISFMFDCNGKINQVFMAASREML